MTSQQATHTEREADRNYRCVNGVPMEEIQAFCQRVGDTFHPEGVILFGSHATGTTTPDSDVDIAVIMDTQRKPFWQSVEILQAIRRKFPIDLIVKTPADIERRRQWGDPFVRDIVEHGVVMYESPR